MIDQFCRVTESKSHANAEYTSGNASVISRCPMHRCYTDSIADNTGGIRFAVDPYCITQGIATLTVVHKNIIYAVQSLEKKKNS